DSLIPRVFCKVEGRGVIGFYCPSRLARERAKHFLIKEPETRRWIDEFQADDIFWDIGANIGVFSLYAALTPGVRVFSFEPLFSNFYTLVKNLELNRFNQVAPFCIGFSSESKIDAF